MDSSLIPHEEAQAVKNALQILDLEEPFSFEDLQEHFLNACRTWHPGRYAGLTNNPSKYMEMYKKGELKTKEIQSAFEILYKYLKLQLSQSVSHATIRLPPQ